MKERITVYGVIYIYPHFLKRTLWKGFRKLYATGCEGHIIRAGFIMLKKIRNRKQRTDIVKYSFVNRTIKNWKQLPAGALGTFLVNLKFLERELGNQL